MKVTETDLATIRDALDGDTEAFNRVVRRFGRFVYSQCYALLHDHHETEDTVQEAFLRAYRYRVRLDRPEKFLSWLITIARNLARDRLRRRCRVSYTAEPLPPGLSRDPYPEPSRELASLEDMEALRNAVSALPDHYREAISLRYLQGCSYTSIQRQMGITDGALRGILVRALRSLRNALSARNRTGTTP